MLKSIRDRYETNNVRGRRPAVSAGRSLKERSPLPVFFGRASRGRRRVSPGFGRARVGLRIDLRRGGPVRAGRETQSERARMKQRVCALSFCSFSEPRTGSAIQKKIRS